MEQPPDVGWAWTTRRSASAGQASSMRWRVEVDLPRRFGPPQAEAGVVHQEQVVAVAETPAQRGRPGDPAPSTARRRGWPRGFQIRVAACANSMTLQPRSLFSTADRRNEPSRTRRPWRNQQQSEVAAQPLAAGLAPVDGGAEGEHAELDQIGLQQHRRIDERRRRRNRWWPAPGRNRAGRRQRGAFSEGRPPARAARAPRSAPSPGPREREIEGVAPAALRQ